jgi:hypothetical protein
MRLRNLDPRHRKTGPMQSSPQSASTCQPAAAGETQSRKREDLAYQAVTVAAILLVLCSVWVF